MINKQLRVVGYARYSSELQREESIEAQEREIREYCDRNGYILLRFYEDRALSGKTADRKEFQEMIYDSKSGDFDAVVVHKLDRFSRSQLDTLTYQCILEENNVKLLSVLENLDNSPESKLLQAVMAGISEYYIGNLAREVEKGKKENAYKGNHVGGIPPLGYDVDKTTKKLVINETEALAVKKIYQMILDGKTYGEVIDELTIKGYKTKSGGKFGKNSLFSILKNEKYTGTYIYNKSEKAKGLKHKRNGHAYKDDSEIIRVENGCPAIISKEDFDKVQSIMSVRQKRAGSFKARETYLLSGKIICGECGSAYVGNSRKASDTHPHYVSYRCTHKNGKIKCHTGEVNRDMLDESVVNLISNIVFDDSKIENIVSAYKEYYNSQDDTYKAEINRLEKLIKEADKKIYNLVSAIAKVGISEALEESLKATEEEKANINYQLSNVKLMAEKSTLTDETIIKAFNSVKAEFRKGTLNGVKEIIDMFVDKVIVYADRVEVVLYYGSDLLKLISSEYANAPTLVRFPIKDFLINFEDKKRKHNFEKNCVFLGGEGGI